MANQPPHQWNANLYHEAEKKSKDSISLAHKIIKNAKGSNQKVVSLEDPITIVSDLADLACTLLEVAEEHGVTSEMVVRLMGKRAGGREQAMNHLLPQVKKEIKLEMRDSKTLTIPRLDQKRADIAAGKRHPKAKGRGKGLKSAREIDTNDSTGRMGEAVQAEAGSEHLADQVFERSESQKRRRTDLTNPIFGAENDNKENERAESDVVS